MSLLRPRKIIEESSNDLIQNFKSLKKIHIMLQFNLLCQLSLYFLFFQRIQTDCCGQLWVRHMFCFSGLVMDYTTYSEIDHIHLSSEAQCVSHHLSQVDCHNVSLDKSYALPDPGICTASITKIWVATVFKVVYVQYQWSILVISSILNYTSVLNAYPTNESLQACKAAC